MTAIDPIPYSDAKIRRILSTVRTIAMVGASSNWNRPSYFVMKYLQGKGYRVIPVNPGTAGQEQLGEKIYASLRDIPDKIDMVDVFRASDQVGPIVDDAIAIGAKVVWMQLGIRNDEAAARAEAAGVEVIMNRCPKIEFGRLGGELSWSGVNSGIIRNHAPEAPTERRTKPRALPSANVSYGFETRAIHAGAAPDPTTGARITPIFQTAAYVFDDVDHAASLFNLHNFGYIYARLTNPTVAVMEERIASLEGGRAACAAASGHAAQFLIFATMMEQGDEFVASRNLYGGSLTQFGLSFKKLGWTCHFVDPHRSGELPPRADAALQGDLPREPRQSRRHRRRSGSGGEDRARGGHSADRRQHAGDAVPVPADRMGRRPGRAFDHEVPRRPWQFAGRRGGGERQVRLVAGRKVPGADGAGARLSWAALLRELRRLRLHHQGARGGVARLRPDAGADECVPDDHRHRDAARSHGAPCGERAEGGGVSWNAIRAWHGSPMPDSS